MLSFQNLLGLELRVPEATTIWIIMSFEEQVGPQPLSQRNQVYCFPAVSLIQKHPQKKKKKIKKN